VEISPDKGIDTQDLAAFGVLFALAEQRSFRYGCGSNRERRRPIPRRHLQAQEMIFPCFVAKLGIVVHSSLCALDLERNLRYSSALQTGSNAIAN
jgi:hypothetical protein